MFAPPPPVCPPYVVVPGTPVSPNIIVNCVITAELTTTDCVADPDPGHPGATDAVLAALRRVPLHLPGAPVDQRLEIALIRDEIGKPHADGPPPATPYKPEFAKRPTYEDVARYYPERAQRMEVDGVSVTRCKVTDDGRLNECWTKRADPPDVGFNEAAIRVVRALRYQPPGPDAPAYQQRTYDQSVRWTVPHPAPPVPAASPPS